LGRECCKRCCGGIVLNVDVTFDVGIIPEAIPWEVSWLDLETLTEIFAILTLGKA
jgi:hypothetical protein